MAASTIRGIRSGFIAGAVAALVMILAQAVARATAGVPMFPDLFDDLTMRLVPSPVISRALNTPHFPARPLLFVVLLVVQVIAGAVVGGAASVWLGPRPGRLGGRASPWENGMVLAAALWLATDLIVLPMAGQGSFGTRATVGAIGLNLALMIGFALYGVTSVAMLRIIDDASAAATLAGVDVVRGHAVTKVDRRRRLG